MRTMLKQLLIAAVVLSVLAAVQAKKDKQLYCGGRCGRVDLFYS